MNPYESHTPECQLYTNMKSNQHLVSAYLDDSIRHQKAAEKAKAKLQMFSAALQVLNADETINQEPKDVLTAIVKSSTEEFVKNMSAFENFQKKANEAREKSELYQAALDKIT